MPTVFYCFLCSVVILAQACNLVVNSLYCEQWSSLQLCWRHWIASCWMFWGSKRVQRIQPIKRSCAFTVFAEFMCRVRTRRRGETVGILTTSGRSRGGEKCFNFFFYLLFLKNYRHFSSVITKIILSSVILKDFRLKYMYLYLRFNKGVLYMLQALDAFDSIISLE